MALLRVITGPDVGATAEVRESPVTIGRGIDCALQVTDEHVSVVHAVVEPVDAGFRVRDLESTGGTAVNGKPVLERRLLFGDIITVGETTIVFGSGEETIRTETVGSAETPLPGDAEVV